MKKSQLKELEAKYEELDEYDSYWEGDVIGEREKRYARYIGTFLIRFSNLEYNLDMELADLINDSFHYEGYIIIKDLQMAKKIELFYNLLLPMLNFVEKDKKQKIKELLSIEKELKYLNTLRNKIAHAKWNTLDASGYVRLDTKLKEDGFVQFKRFKITQGIIKSGIKRIEPLIERLDNFTENMWVD